MAPGNSNNTFPHLLSSGSSALSLNSAQTQYGINPCLEASHQLWLNQGYCVHGAWYPNVYILKARGCPSELDYCQCIGLLASIEVQLQEVWGVPDHKNSWRGSLGGRREHTCRFLEDLQTLLTSWPALGKLTNAPGHSVPTSKMDERGIVVHVSNFSQVGFQ